MKTNPVIFLAFLLTGSVPFIDCQPPPNQTHFNQFLERLKNNIDDSSYDILPCLAKDDVIDVIESLKKTSHNFIDLCIRYDADVKRQSGKFSPVLALQRAIERLFDLYRKSAKQGKNMLSYLEISDPIGLNVYLTQKKVNESSPNFVDSVEDFQTEMHKQIFIDNDIQNSFDDFLLRLKPRIEGSSNRLSFTAKDNLIDKLNQTSTKFKVLCASYHTVALNEGNYSPIKVLKEAIDDVFNQYKDSAGENKHILNQIESVDPIGLNVYLTNRNVTNSSPNFMKFVEEFRTKVYKEVPIVVGSEYSLGDFLEFIQRLVSPPTVSVFALPFTLKIRPIAYLWETSAEFKELCVKNEREKQQQNGNDSPASSLMKTIQYFAKDKNDIKIIDEIQSGDPIGLNVYLTQKNVSKTSPTFMQTVGKFQQTMLERIRLLKSGKDDSYLESLKENRKTKLPKIPENIRMEITTEYSALNHKAMDYFIEIAVKQFRHIKMYPVRSFHSIEKFKQHNSSKINDVQILYDGEIGAKVLGHAICIFYQASSQKVHVYDSLVFDQLDSFHKEIIDRLYPFNKGIVFDRPKIIQGNTKTCAIFSIMYATMLLLGDDPTKNDFKLNTVSGDETLYMRLHILNMFVKQKLFLIEDKPSSSSMYSKFAVCISPKVKK